MKTNRNIVRLFVVLMLATFGLLSFDAQKAAAFGGNDVNFQQCANGKVAPYTCSWINGIVQESNSTYAEGMALPQRILFTSLDTVPNTTGGNYTLTLSHDSTKGGIHAFDWIVGYGQAANLAADANIPYAGAPLNPDPVGFPLANQAWPDSLACQGFAGATLATCNALNDDANLFYVDILVPNDPYTDTTDGSYQTRINAFEAAEGDRYIRIWGTAPFTGGAAANYLVLVGHTGADTGDSSANYELHWQSESTSVLIQYATHISMSLGSYGWGTGNGASNISGGPYHNNLDRLNDNSLGAQDNQLKGSDIINPASITINKVCVNTQTGSFGFNVTQPAGGPYDTSATPDFSVACGAGNAKTNILVFGNYTVVEAAPQTGWALTALSCTGDTNVSTTLATRTAVIDLDAGENVVCTYTNTLQQGTLNVCKVVVNDNGGTNVAGDWSLHVREGGTVGAGNEVANSPQPGVAPATCRSYTLVAGDYNVAETGAPTGYTFDGYSGDCADANNGTLSGGGVTVTAGGTKTCTLTNNDQAASLTIVKVTNPTPDPTDFAFTTTGSGLSSFSLDTDAADLTLSNQKVFTGLSAGNYAVAETTPSGWTQTSATCTDGSAVSAIALSLGESVTCTFTNTKGATLTIIKDAVPNDAQDFAFTATGTGTSSFSLDDDADPGLSTTQTFNFTGAQLGAKTVTEAANPAGWALTNIQCTGATADLATRTISVTLAAGGSATCTFTNTKSATLTIIKDAVPNDAQDFAFTATGTGTSSFSLDDDADPGVSNTKTFTFDGSQLGAKTVTEGANPAGWTLTNIQCTGATADLATRTISVTLAAGGSATCTYTNTKGASLTIIKDAVPNNAQDFAFAATGTGTSNFALDDDADPTLSNTKTFNFDGSQLGAKTVTEGANPAGWSLTNVQCTGATADLATRTISVTLAAGGSATCTFTNTASATLTIIKDAVPNDATDFGFTGSGAGTSNFSLDDDADPALANTKVLTFTGADLTGAKQITENANPSGWTLSAVQCSAGGTADLANRRASATLNPGDAVTCTFTNTRLASITIIKNVTIGGVDASAPDNFSFTDSIAGCDFGPLDDDADPALSNTATCNNLLPGTGITVAESAATGWALTNISCTTGGSGVVATRTATINLPAGGAVTCTFTNNQAIMPLIKTFNGQEPTCVDNPNSSDPAVMLCTINGGATPVPQFTFGLFADSQPANPLAAPANFPTPLFSVVVPPRKSLPGPIGIPFSICEMNPGLGSSGWHLSGLTVDIWTTNVPNDPNNPTNPNSTISPTLYNFNDGGANTAVCFDVLIPNDANRFELNADNTQPGGTRTIGYWSNWTTCDGKGNQVDVAANNGGSAEGFWLLDDVLSSLDIGVVNFSVNGCEKAVDLLKKSDIGDPTIVGDGANRANDGAYSLAAQLIAAEANYEAGAVVCGNTTLAIARAKALLDAINFTGTGSYLAPRADTWSNSTALRQYAQQLAAVLDAYNNIHDTGTCADVPTPPAVVTPLP
jgi:hypothetical protein